VSAYWGDDGWLLAVISLIDGALILYDLSLLGVIL